MCKVLVQGTSTETGMYNCFANPITRGQDEAGSLTNRLAKIMKSD